MATSQRGRVRHGDRIKNPNGRFDRRVGGKEGGADSAPHSAPLTGPLPSRSKRQFWNSDAFVLGKRGAAIDIVNRKSERRFMSATISAPEPWVRSVGDLRLPPQADERLQELMDRNNEGLLGGTERAELAALAEWSETVSLLRAEALQLLGRVPA